MESKDNFGDFGEGFEGFPRRIPEDCVEYSLFIIETKLKSQKEILTRLETVRKEALKLTENLLKEYIWQRESFHLEIESKRGRMYLHGLTSYGDSVEDEWLIVYILRELSNRFPELWIKAVDTDGEFLLIEAANALPRWLNPEIADNRVWIHNNALRIIPLSAALSRSLSLEEALITITSTPQILINSPMIEEEAFYRLRNYPSQIAAAMHNAIVTIPRKLAHILHEIPASIAPAVEAFYLRDPIALKPLQTNSASLIFPPVDLVTISVHFTKILYAQLKSQQFSPPSAWGDILSQAGEDIISDFHTQKRYSKLEMGMKVTSGFEMLVTDTKNEDHRRVREIKILLDDLATDEDSGLPRDPEIAKWPDVNREDDETWLDINFEDFENELKGKNREEKKPAIPGTFGPEPPPAFGDGKTQADVKRMVERFEAFLNDEDAGLDGAEMDEMDIDNDDEDEDEDTEEDSEDEDKDVSFDEKEFAKMMREMMGMPPEEIADDLSSKGAKSKFGESSRIEGIDTDDENGTEDETSKIRKVMERMEAELNDAGALNLDPTPSKLSALKGKGQQDKARDETSKYYWEDGSDEDGGDEDVSIDFNLAKNLLESFKSQGGMAGPGGNLLGMMGMQLPRDMDDTEGPKKKT